MLYETVLAMVVALAIIGLATSLAIGRSRITGHAKPDPPLPPAPKGRSGRSGRTLPPGFAEVGGCFIRISGTRR